MTRSIETLEHIKKYHNCKVNYHRELAEINQVIFNLSFENQPANNEKVKVNMKRAVEGRRFFKKLLKKNEGKKILLVGHGNAISTFIGYGLGRSIKDTPRLSLKNCSITAAMFYKGKITLIPHIGLMDHLKRPTYQKVINEPILNKLIKKTVPK